MGCISIIGELSYNVTIMSRFTITCIELNTIKDLAYSRTPVV